MDITYCLLIIDDTLRTKVTSEGMYDRRTLFNKFKELSGHSMLC